MMICRWLFTLIAYLSSFQAVAKVPSLRCRGQLLIYGVTKNNNVNQLNRKMDGFEASISEYSYFFAGLDSHRRFIEVYPWSGISAKDFSDKYKDDASIEYTSDKRTYFSLRITAKRTGLSRSVRCSL